VLQHANVETFVVVRASSPLVVALCDWRFMGRALPDGRSAAVLLLILAGAAAYVRQDATLSAAAAGWAAAWMLVFCFDQIFIKHGARTQRDACGARARVAPVLTCPSVAASQSATRCP
jgi:drug/metabolite transporter (DMT)-like permease